LAWQDAQAQAAKVAKERDNANDKANRLEKMLALSGSANPADLVKISEQEILKIESIDTKDWDTIDKALTYAKSNYREISRNRIEQLQYFSETSPTIRRIDAELASQESVVRKALQLRDQADHQMFIELDEQLATKRAGRTNLIEKVGRLPTSVPVLEIENQIATILATQTKYINGHERAIGKQSVDVTSILDEITIKALKPGKVAGELLVIHVNGIDIQFRWCPAGSFQMGDQDAVKVTHSQGFWMMETECWQALWVAVMGSSKSSEWTQQYGVGYKHPVYNVSHEEATQFARKLNQLLYAEGVITGYEFRLPTEAQWEYAVRAGSISAYCYGDDVKKLDEYAWYGKNSGDKNHSVKTKLANAWGIHDGHGSVLEWCSDWYDSKYPKGPLTDPVGPSTGLVRAIRGGSFISYDPSDCKSAYRFRDIPSDQSRSLGFRLALCYSKIPKSP
jgi:formylglycine-generating enzyme required for sulfatase activity